MKLTMIGTGYVGLVSGACFADLGHDVTCVDIDEAKIEGLRGGVLPIVEDGLGHLVQRNAASGRLAFTTTRDNAHVSESDAVFLAVGTPSRLEDGEADLQYLFSAIESLMPHFRDSTLLVSKSTVPVGTGDRIAELVRRLRPDALIDVVSCPEFLREGSAMHDFMRPDRVVVGAESDEAIRVMRNIYAPILDSGIRFCAMDRRSAEIVKYAANALLATKIAFVNEIADFCEKAGANVDNVIESVGLDPRIGSAFMQPGPGYGGSCFPKDTLAFLRHGESFETSLQILETAVTVNERRKRKLAQRVVAACGGSVAGKRIAVLGVTFKANTDDMRDSPSIPIVRRLKEFGAHLVAYDPCGRSSAEKLAAFDGVAWAETARAAIAEAEAAVIITEWDEFRDMSFAVFTEAMLTPVVVDFRNLFDPAEAEAAGVAYWSIGRPKQEDGDTAAQLPVHPIFWTEGPQLKVAQEA